MTVDGQGFFASRTLPRTADSVGQPGLAFACKPYGHFGLSWQRCRGSQVLLAFGNAWQLSWMGHEYHAFCSPLDRPGKPLWKYLQQKHVEQISLPPWIWFWNFFLSAPSMAAQWVFRPKKATHFVSPMMSCRGTMRRHRGAAIAWLLVLATSFPASGSGCGMRSIFSSVGSCAGAPTCQAICLQPKD